MQVNIPEAEVMKTERVKTDKWQKGGRQMGNELSRIDFSRYTRRSGNILADSSYFS